VKPLLPQAAQDVMGSIGLGRHHRRGPHHRLA
jgi:hypothetical protein